MQLVSHGRLVFIGGFTTVNFDAWIVDLPTLSATHACGFRLEVEGSPKDPCAVHPGKFPAGLSSIDQVRLVRTGVEAIAKAADSRSAKPSPSKPVPTQSVGAPLKDKPSRPVLSLKKRQPENS